MSKISGLSTSATEPTLENVAAQKAFLELPPDTQTKLLSAASASNLVFRHLAEGRWGSMVRALRGLALQKSNPSYADLARIIELQTPNVLDS